MSAIHAYCSGCGRKTSVQWVPSIALPRTEGGTKTMKAGRLCADCIAKLPVIKPKGTVEK